jgi:diguanylate cyclase (GGDEF)-like protein
MTKSPPVRVLLICRSDGDAQRLERMLLGKNAADGTFQVTSDAATIPTDEAIDVLITDVDHAELAAKIRIDRRSVATASMAIVRLGSSSSNQDTHNGDAVTLPLDCTERELRLACELSAQLARLRNQRDELARSQAEVMQLAETDPLTGLANRRAWDARLMAMLGRLDREGKPFWLALIDLDAFKAINDRHGMSRGDEVLVTVGKSLAAALRRNDLVARLGGDEFGVLLSDVGEAQVGIVLERLRSSVAKSGSVTASIGYIAARAGADRGSLLAAAERALRAAKSAGGDRLESAVLSS